MKRTAQHPQNKVLALEVLHFRSFAATPTNTQNDHKMDFEMTPNLTKLVSEAPQKQCQKQAFRCRCVAFLQFCSITNKYAKLQQNGPRKNTKSYQIGAGGSPKAMPKNDQK